MATKHTFTEHVLRVIAVIGLIAVLLLGAWGIIQLAFYIPGFLNRFVGGSTPAPVAAIESLSVSLPVAVGSNQVFPLSWSHKNGSGAYSYSITYACVDGLSVKAPLPNGTLTDVKCNTPFNYLNATTTSPLVVIAQGSENKTATFTVTATSLANTSKVTTGSNKTTVAPVAKAKTTTTVKKPTTSTNTGTRYVASNRTTNLYGASDLAVRITPVGTVRAGSLVQLQFTIENVGTNITPANWTFSAALPYQPTYTYQSAPQQALYPGDKIVYTLSYTAMSPFQNNYCTMQYPNYNCSPYWNDPYSTMGQHGGMSTASVTVDPNNYVSEFQETNNYAATSYQVY